MRICVVQLGDINDCFVSSSLNKGFFRKYRDADIVWLVKGDDERSLFDFTDRVTALRMSDFLVVDDKPEFDLVVNLTPAIHPSDPIVRAKEVRGFNLEEISAEYYDILYGSRKTQMNAFQVYFKLAGMTWRGEGYGMSYYPKTRSKKNTAAIAINNAKLRHYVNDHVDVDTLRMHLVPYKRNIFKRMDEINRASYVVTDDQLTMHIGIFLRKYVHFLETVPMTTQPEFFGKGQIYKVPAKIAN